MPAKVRIQIEGTGAPFLKLLPVTHFEVPIRIQPDLCDRLLSTHPCGTDPVWVAQKAARNRGGRV